MVKAKVRFSYAVELFVSAESEDALQDWMDSTTPSEAYELASMNGSYPYEEYNEKILCHVSNDSVVDYEI